MHIPPPLVVAGIMRALFPFVAPNLGALALLDFRFSIADFRLARARFVSTPVNQESPTENCFTPG